MAAKRQSLRPIEGAARTLRHRLSLRAEFTLAVLPTAVVLVVFAAVEFLSQNRLLFASLASSAFLIYLDPQHGTNQVRTLVLSQALAAVTGFAAHELTGGGYAAGGAAMIAVITAMIALDAMHPPAVATALSFAFKPGAESNILLFGLALSLIAVLVGLQKAVLWTLAHLSVAPRHSGHDGRQAPPDGA
ncbi:MAG TPA: HPP family protein [Vicinamibacterales bacterium]|nr:HPP family protein [Vicinamibacterales bacterium]